MVLSSYVPVSLPFLTTTATQAPTSESTLLKDQQPWNRSAYCVRHRQQSLTCKVQYSAVQELLTTHDMPCMPIPTTVVGNRQLLCGILITYLRGYGVVDNYSQSKRCHRTDDRSMQSMLRLATRPIPTRNMPTNPTSTTSPQIRNPLGSPCYFYLYRPVPSNASKRESSYGDISQY